MANKKLVKRDYFEILKASYPKDKADYDEVIKFIDHELELLAKKNSADKKPTAQQVANEGVKSAILAGMESGKLYTITDIQKNIPECADLTNQRISAIIRGCLGTSIERVEEKRKAYFRLIED